MNDAAMVECTTNVKIRNWLQEDIKRIGGQNEYNQGWNCDKPRRETRPPPQLKKCSLSLFLFFSQALLSASYVSPYSNMNIWLNWQTPLWRLSWQRLTYLKNRNCHKAAHLNCIFVNQMQVS